MTSGAYALVNLDAIKHNLNKIREYAPHAKIMAVVKSNAYGHGLIKVAEVLKDVDALAVARVNEGLQLRKSGFKNKITVLEGFVCEDELKQLLSYNLEVVVHSKEQIDILEKHHGSNKIGVWLKLDTGMSRLGFNETEFKTSYQRLLSCSGVNQPISLMTHLSRANETDCVETLDQISFFNRVVTPYPGERSIANSAGIIAWAESLSDWVRPGLMLYGASPINNRNGIEFGLKPALSLHSRLIAVKNILAGAAVGYGGVWICKHNTRLGVVAIGYGDGYPRSAKNGTPVLVNGEKVPLIGRVSMDMVTVDLNSQPQAKPGDPVTLWDESLAVEEIAAFADTIPYTLLCGITQRVEKKVYQLANS